MLEIKDLKTYYYTDEKIVKALDGVDLSIEKGQFIGLVGGSGCGKSTLGLSIMRLIDPPGRIVKGSIKLEGQEL
ncbi:MAG: ATP-binding cassette domain-containing protein, partial [Candidatus Margulisiibacteriota bacterium]